MTSNRTKSALLATALTSALLVAAPALAMTYSQAPSLDADVASGKLPPVAQRLPTDPVVETPIDSVGTYGGVMHRVDIDDLGWLRQLLAIEPFAKFTHNADDIRPDVVAKWEWNKAFTEVTLHLRPGMKWSDGVAFNADDIMYWWNDIIGDPKASVAAPDGTIMNGKPMTVTKIDDETVKFTFPEPNPLFMELAARGHYNSAQWLVPAHYMKQYDPKFNSKEKDYTDLLARYNVATRLQQIGMPTLDAWVVTAYVPGQRIVAKRNPYYWKVDTAGHQLPYIDEIDSTLANGDSVRQLALLDATSGKIDFQSREFNLKDVPLLVQGQKKAGYTVKMWQRGDFAWPWLMPIYDTKDKGLVDLYYKQPFREALSYAINRDRLNKVVAYGLAKPRQFSQLPESPEFQSPEGKAFYKKWSQSYAQYDPKKAEQLLDSIGVKDRDGDGFRERPDGTKLQIIVDMPAGDAQTVAAMDLIKSDWEKVGIQTELNPLDDSTLSVRAESGQMEMRAWPSAAAWNLLSSPTVWAPIQDVEWTMGGRSIARWYQTGGKQGTPPRPGSMLDQLQKAYSKIVTITDPAERNKALLAAYKIHLDEGPITIGTIGQSPSPVVVSDKLHNVQATGLIGSWDLGFPATADPEQFYFSK